jgi:hypothetical protein
MFCRQGTVVLHFHIISDDRGPLLKIPVVCRHRLPALSVKVLPLAYFLSIRLNLCSA